nr:hypothetical protein orf32 [uncultured archaeon]
MSLDRVIDVLLQHLAQVGRNDVLVAALDDCAGRPHVFDQAVTADDACQRLGQVLPLFLVQVLRQLQHL